jgi:hypothetical protein
MDEKRSGGYMLHVTGLRCAVSRDCERCLGNDDDAGLLLVRFARKEVSRDA